MREGSLIAGRSIGAAFAAVLAAVVGAAAPKAATPRPPASAQSPRTGGAAGQRRADGPRPQRRSTDQPADRGAGVPTEDAGAESAGGTVAPPRHLTVVVAGLAAVLAATQAPAIPVALAADWPGLAALTLLVLVAQRLAIDIYGRGRISTSVVCLLATAFLFGAAGVVVAAPLVGIYQWLRSRGTLSGAVFDSGAVTLAGLAAAWSYEGLRDLLLGPGAAISVEAMPTLLGLAVVAALVNYAVNGGILVAAIASRGGSRPLQVWNDVNRWLLPHYLVFGPLGLLMAAAYRALGGYGLVAFFAPPLMMRFVTKQYLDRTVRYVEELRQANRRIEAAYEDTLHALAAALDVRDTDTEGHAERVASYVGMLAEALGVKDPVRLEAIRRGALLHDVGKIGVPDAILRKPAKLDDDEWAVMRQHPVWGYRILNRVEFLREAALIVLHHHERWDGSGYPSGLARDAIPLGARIFTVADVFDALTSERPYRRALSFDDAYDIILQGSGSQFDPRVVRAFVTIAPRLRAIVEAHQAQELRGVER